MTDTPRLRIGPRSQIEDDAATWFERKQFWSWSESDQRALDAWLAESPAHELAYWRLEAGWIRGERMAALRHPDRSATAVSGYRKSPIAVRAAVGFLVAGILCCAAISNYAPRAEETSYRTALGVRRTILLADGSKVELNTNSALRVAFNARKRQVYLDRGEAFFDIKHDASRPFHVTAAQREVTDIGTKFLLRLDGSSRLMMALTEGSARLDVVTSDAVHRQALLSPGDIAVSTDSSLSLRRSSAQQMRQSLGWTRGVLVFDRTTLGDAAAEFNRYNTQKLVIDGSSTAQRTVSGTFQINNVSDFASLARDVLGLHVENRGSEIFISK